MICLLHCHSVGAQEIYLVWDPVPEAAGYLFFYGNEPDAYHLAVDTQHDNSYPITDLLRTPRVHYFAVKAYNALGVESPFETLPPLDFCSYDSEKDLCRYDRDRDDVVFFFDNCPDVYNPDQQDSCGDGIGDACRDDGVACAASETDNETATAQPPESSVPDESDTAAAAPDPTPPKPAGGSGGSSSGSSKKPPQCSADRDCTRGRYCQTTTGTCVPCLEHRHCDDGLFCTGTEFCSNNICISGTDPCPESSRCDEAQAVCAALEPPPECFLDSDCEDDGLFCTGVRFCEDGACTQQAPPCAAPYVCNENLGQCLLESDCLPPSIRTPALVRRHCRYIWLRHDRTVTTASVANILFVHAAPLASGIYYDYTKKEHLLGNFIAIPICIEAGATTGAWSVLIEAFSDQARPLTIKSSLTIEALRSQP